MKKLTLITMACLVPVGALAQSPGAVPTPPQSPFTFNATVDFGYVSMNMKGVNLYSDKGC